MEIEAVYGDVPRLRVVDFVTKQSQDDSMDEDDTESEDSIDISDIKPKVEDSDSETNEIVFPDTIEGIRDRFNQLYVEFTREERHEHRHELILFLDEMLRRGVITPLEYTQLTASLDENLPERASNKEDEDEEDEEDYQKSTFDYIIQHDKEELLELMEELKEDEEFIDEVLKIEELIGLFLEKEFLDGEPTKPMVEEAIRKLESSDIPKSKQHRLKMLLDDTAKNRHRIQSIFT